MDFTEDQIQRYSRHILLQDVGVEGQEKINNGKVLIVGAGGLGAPIHEFLEVLVRHALGRIEGFLDQHLDDFRRGGFDLARVHIAQRSVDGQEIAFMEG